MEDTELVQTRREQRRRRRPPSSFQEERASSLSREGNTSPTGHNSSDMKDARETTGGHSSPRKRRTRRRNSQEQALGESERAVNDTHYHARAARERPHQKKDSPSKRMPRSVSEEVLAMQGKFPPPPTEAEPTEVRRHRRSRRREQGDQSHDHGHEDSGTVSGDHHSAEKTLHKLRSRQPPRKKKKTRNAFITSGEEDNYQGDVDGEVSEVFKVDKEDIVANDTATTSPSKVPTLSAPTLPSQPLDYLFIEKKDGQGFVKEHKTKLTRVDEEHTDYAKEVMELHSANTSIDLALQVHVAFRTFALFCHGLLAGLALVQCLFVYTLSNVSNINFLNNYQVLAQPFQAMYYFLLVISTVSVFDRFVNVSSGCRQFFLGLLTYPSRALALLVYLIGLSFSLGLVQMDERISLYKEDPSLWTSLKQVSTWKILNVFRVAGAIAGWFFVSLNPVDDLTAKHLTAIVDLHTNEITSERSAVSYPV